MWGCSWNTSLGFPTVVHCLGKVRCIMGGVCERPPALPPLGTISLYDLLVVDLLREVFASPHLVPLHQSLLGMADCLCFSRSGYGHIRCDPDYFWYLCPKAIHNRSKFDKIRGYPIPSKLCQTRGSENLMRSAFESVRPRCCNALAIKQNAQQISESQKELKCIETYWHKVSNPW